MARRGNGFGHGWGRGPGWGGPARGAGSRAAKAAPFTAGNRAAAGEHNMSRSQRRQALLDMLFNLARTADSEEVQLAAIVAWLNRVEGEPVVQAIHIHSDDLDTLDDVSLEQRLRLLKDHIETQRVHERVRE